MSPIGPLDFEARERIADRERMAAPLRTAAEGRRERLEWASQPRRRPVRALTRVFVAGIAWSGGVLRRLVRQPAAPRTPVPIEPLAVDPPA